MPKHIRLPVTLGWIAEVLQMGTKTRLAHLLYAHASIKHLNGTAVEVWSSWYTGLSPVQRHKLKPRERITLAVRKLVFENEPNKELLGFGEGYAVAGAGEYLVRYDPVMITGGSGKAEWSGRLISGETRVRVRE